MALANIDLQKRAEQIAALTATQHDANLSALETAINALNAVLTPAVVAIAAGAKVGATAGWAVADATDRGGLAKCPASQTAATLVVPLSGLTVGRRITGYTVRGQLESAGNTVTLDAALRKLTVAAGDLTDEAVTSGAITQVSATADQIVASTVAGLTETIAAGVTYYVLLTATTAASTDLDLTSIDVTLTVP